MVLGIGSGEALEADLFSGGLKAQHGRVVLNASSADENGECSNDAKTRLRRDLRLIGLCLAVLERSISRQSGRHITIRHPGGRVSTISVFDGSRKFQQRASRPAQSQRL